MKSYKGKGLFKKTKKERIKGELKSLSKRQKRLERNINSSNKLMENKIH